MVEFELCSDNWSKLEARNPELQKEPGLRGWSTGGSVVRPGLWRNNEGQMLTGRLDPDYGKSQMFEWEIGTYFVSNWRTMKEQLTDEICKLAEKV